MNAYVKPTKEQVKQWVQEQMPAFLEDLIAITNIRSVAEVKDAEVAPFGQGCLDVLEKMLEIGRDYGFQTKNYDNYVGCIQLNDLAEDIGIWAHLDVVDEGTGWVYPPYEAQIKDGYVIGRGCQDNKSSAIVGLYALKFLKEFQVPVQHNVKLFLGTCEEQGMYDLDYFTAHYPCPKLSLVPDSGFPVCLGERGTFNGSMLYNEEFSNDIIDLYSSESAYMLADRATIVLQKTEELLQRITALPEEITVTVTEHITCSASGIARNAGNPFSEGNKDNALQTLLVALHEHHVLREQDDRLLSLCRELNTNYDGKALGIDCTDELSGPLVLACVSAKLENRRLKVSFLSRYPISKNNVDFEGITAAACKENGCELTVTRHSRANYFDPAHPAVEKLTAVYNDFMGLDTKPFVMSGGTYARKLPNAFAFGTGMPLPKAPEGLFLPGHGDYHQPDESISILRMQNALNIYILSLLEIA